MKGSTHLIILALFKISTVFSANLRIIGGTEAEPNSAPYMVSLIANENGILTPFCAGTILNKNWILTAAHCLQIHPTEIVVLAGHHYLRDFNASIHQVRKGDLVYCHPEFKGMGPNDIGLLHISPPLNITNNVQSVSLAETLILDQDVIVQGWGSTLPVIGRKRAYATALQRTNLTLITVEKCQTFYPVSVDRERNFCSEYKNRNTCTGDSGGPVLQRDGTQIGIIAWGATSCEYTIGPSVFTKISFFRKWIGDAIYSFTGDDIFGQRQAKSGLKKRTLSESIFDVIVKSILRVRVK